MLTSIRAVYEKGRLRPLDPLELAEGQEVTVTIQPADEMTAVRAALGDTVRWADPTAGDPNVDEDALLKSVRHGLNGVRSLTDIIIEERREGR